ncbi:aspartate aminotransferase family protein [Rhodococcus sp. ACPA1]|nr:aspartate aminotransferase family protein [Rhodococcus sp. ACPA1]
MAVLLVAPITTMRRQTVISPRVTQTRVFHRDLKNQWPSVDRTYGEYIWDTEGNKYLDATAGGSVVVNVGYSVPRVLAAMQEQAALACFSAAFTSQPQEELGFQVAHFAPGDLDYVRFTSGGSEANESAIKLARKYFVEAGKPDKWKVIGRHRGFHGNTLGALSATGHRGRRAEYEPLLVPFPHVSAPYRYRCEQCAAGETCTNHLMTELESVIASQGSNSIAAFIAEPVVGAASMGTTPPPDYWPRLREVCDKHDILLIADEVMTGMGRTGRNFAVDHWGVVPDMITSGKGIGSGYTPLGAVIARRKIWEAVSEGTGQWEHGFTYGGNPLSCAVGLAVLRCLQDQDLVQQAATNGDYLKKNMVDQLGEHPLVGEIDGLGMHLGIELVADRTTKRPFAKEVAISKRVAAACRSRGVLVNPTFTDNGDGLSGDRFGVTPIFTFTRAQLDQTVEAVQLSLDEVLNNLSAKN